jgi:hypothetical protein
MSMAIPKLAKGKMKQRVIQKGKVVATSTLEMKFIAQKKNNRKKASLVKKFVFAKEEEGDPDSGDDNIEKIILDDSDKDSEFMEELVSSLKPDEFEDLERDARVDDYVLVEFRISGRKIYMGMVTKERDSNNDCEVSFFRTSSKKINAVMKPQVKDLAAVNQSQIKIILLQPDSCEQTKRQRGYISLGIDFFLLHMG